MATTLELTNELGKVYYQCSYDEQHQWVYSNWIGFVTMEELKEAANTGLKLVQQYSCPKLLKDNRQLEGSWDEANEWLASDWMPRALGGGLKKFAHIVSPDLFGAMPAEEMVTNMAEFGFQMRIFNDRPEAEEWLAKGQ